MKGRRASLDSWALAGAGLAVVIGLGWVLVGERRIAQVPAAPPTLLARAPRLPVVPPMEQSPAGWPDPLATTDDASWVFDVFTPPLIQFDPVGRRFTVTPTQPDGEAGSAGAGAAVELVGEAPLPLSLVSASRQLYRLQLVGYAGTEEDSLGIFQNEISGEAVVARAGAKITELGLEVRELTVRREDTRVPDSMPLREIVAVAEVWDATDHRMVRLSSARRQWQDAAVAVLRVEGVGLRTVKAGDRVEAQGRRFLVEAVEVEPAAVVIRPEHGDPARDSLILHLTTESLTGVERPDRISALQP